jgi:hypothetical protein
LTLYAKATVWPLASATRIYQGIPQSAYKIKLLIYSSRIKLDKLVYHED